jgi:L-2-hydroxyglutarate oxidase
VVEASVLPRTVVARADVRAEQGVTGVSQHRDPVVVVGGGIIGLATAHALLQHRPERAVVLVEKEREVAQHQTGRNSGVLHSGIYYRPGSLKASTAVAGRRAMEQFCDEHGVAYDRCGKVIVAVDPRELPRLGELEARAHANGVTAKRIGVGRLRELEPNVRGIAALHVPDTGVVDYGQVARALAASLRDAGAELRFGERVVGIHERADEVVVETERDSLRGQAVVNCAGLQSDVVAGAALGARPDVRIVPFRGEYHEVVGRSAALVRTLVYPVPDPDLPFLGVHISRGIDGRVHVGPNAVLALRREGYSWGEVDPAELLHLAAFPGIWKLARRFWRTSAAEIARSASRRLLARAVARMVPDLDGRDLVPSPAGVRAQALGRDGTLHDDFVLRETPHAVHVLNAPSPGATASLVIGDTIARRLDAHT